MKRHGWLIPLGGLLLGGCLLGGCGDDDAVMDPDGSVGMDSDGDTITDADEGAGSRADTDGDGTLDFNDTDSDGDGILDRVEAGDQDLGTLPHDADADLVPNFRDLDADGNGFPDAVEGTEDNDLDGIEDFQDIDDDNDLVPDASELGGLLDPPADIDADGVPNYRDPDSDDDLIIDGDEFAVDTDRDGLIDWEDLDSDADGLSDEMEAGDRDIRSQPIDTDGDLKPDFRDPDSDNDGLSDRAEVENGTIPILADSDGDMVDDLIEAAAGTDPLDPSTSPRTRGDFVFVVPFEQDPMPPRDTLQFRTNIQFADIYFLFDASGSMDNEIDALRGAVTGLITELTCTDSRVGCGSDSECGSDQICSAFTSTCIEDPSTSSCLLSPWTGAGYYETELNNVLSLQEDPARTATALSFTTFGGTEQLNRCVWGLADPAAAPGVETGCTGPGPGAIGCPSFREDAVRIMVAFTDEDSDGPEPAAAAGEALRDAGIAFIGVWSESPSAPERRSLVDVAIASESVDRDGAPLVYDGADVAIVPAISSAINEIVEGVPLRATIEATDEPDDAGNSLQFIERLETNTSGGRCVNVGVEDTDGDGRPDTFPAVLPGTPVCWDVIAKRNDTVMPELVPLVYRARLTVRGDGSPLDSRIVYFLIPPTIEDPGGPD
jgi:hypothetical protein